MNTVTMSRQCIELAFLMFAFLGVFFGYIIGRVHEMHQQDYPKQRKQRRTPQQRHTRSHW